MNDAQWLWSYYNVIEDEKEEGEWWKVFKEDFFYMIDVRRFADYKRIEKSAMRSTMDITKLTNEQFDYLMKDMKRYNEVVSLEPSPKQPVQQQRHKYEDLDEIY